MLHALQRGVCAVKLILSAVKLLFFTIGETAKGIAKIRDNKKR